MTEMDPYSEDAVLLEDVPEEPARRRRAPMPEAKLRNATGFVLAVENTLGWVAEETADKPLWKIRAIEAGKVNKKIKTNPDLYTWENLAHTVEYCRRNKIAVKSPAAVLWHTEKALAEKAKPQRARPLQQLVDEAIAFEMGAQREDSDMWIARFSRASGPGLVSTYREWAQIRQVTP